MITFALDIFGQVIQVIFAVFILAIVGIFLFVQWLTNGWPFNEPRYGERTQTGKTQIRGRVPRWDIEIDGISWTGLELYVSKGKTDNPQYEAHYLGPNNSREIKFFGEEEYEASKDLQFLSGRKDTIKILTSGDLFGDKLKIRDQKGQINQLRSYATTLEHRLHIKAQDSPIQEILGIQIRKAIQSSGTLEAQGRNNEPCNCDTCGCTSVATCIKKEHDCCDCG